MLHVWMGDYTNAEEALTKPDGYFNQNFKFENLMTDFARRLIYECSEGTVMVEGGMFEHPDFGRHGMAELASGIKTTLLAKFNKEMVTNMVFCGDNCIPFIVEASREEDVTVSTQRYIYWYESGLVDDVDKIHIMNDDSYVSNSLEYLGKWIKYQDTVIDV